jgi:hypothetical protein
MNMYVCPIHPQASDPVVAGTLPNAGAFGNLEAKDRCCIESGLIYEQKNAILGLQVVPHYLQPYSKLPAAATTSGQHVAAAAASSCRPVLLNPCSGMKLSVEHVFTK